jgi:hypothetical protein
MQSNIWNRLYDVGPFVEHHTLGTLSPPGVSNFGATRPACFDPPVDNLSSPNYGKVRGLGKR